MTCPVCKSNDEIELNNLVMMKRFDLDNLITKRYTTPILHNRVDLICCKECGVIFGKR